MPQVKHIPQYTYSDYQKWEGDWELIDGVPFAMSPSASGEHQFVAFEITNSLGSQLKSSQCKAQCYLYYELDWIVSDDTVLRPDILIVCGEKVKDFVRTAPVLIVEILSKSSLYNDRVVKKAIYESMGVKYYLIVNPDDRTVEVFQLVNEQYQSAESWEFSLNENCKISLSLNEIWE